MYRRIFIAINLPDRIRKKLAEHQAVWPELPARWTKPENLHITVVFLGNISEMELPSICEITNEVAQRHTSFFINLNQVCYGPPKKIPPRMIWAKGEPLMELTKLKEDLEQSLSGSVNFHHEERALVPHITLARIKTWDWQKIELEERPTVEKDLDIKFEVESIDIMESELKRNYPTYIILESIPLKF
ncbi:RNA 2',3'-cyclic phosphodiesterase [Patescibacteria group bacterium]|nr:RNA 2',3'-cyclic phosphodiesterase [Patescibacteria group bacterium]MBU1876943.1 RNA 2',3'-cyclic phosphodiesterase [Patescibacteria group bacterium]